MKYLNKKSESDNEDYNKIDNYIEISLLKRGKKMKLIQDNIHNRITSDNIIKNIFIYFINYQNCIIDI